MKLSISQTELQHALATVVKGISLRSTLPVLSGVFMQAEGDTLTMQTTDLELSVQYSTNALVEEEGCTVVPGKLFAEIVKNLPEAAIHIEGADDTLMVACDASSFSLKTLNPQDFPGFPHVDTTQAITIPFDRFASMVKCVARVVSKDESRAILTGVLITLEDTHLKMVATDSYRLAIAEADVPASMAGDFSAVVLGSFLNDIAGLPKTSGPVALALSENQIVISYQDTVFINRRIEGNFPNYKQLLPESYSTRIELSPPALVAAVKRASLLSSASTPVRMDINIASQTVQLSSMTRDVGSAQENLACKGEGDDTEIAFNFAYLIDGLNAVTADTVFLEVQNSMKPGIFRSDQSEKFLYLVMPVRLS